MVSPPLLRITLQHCSGISPALTLSFAPAMSPLQHPWPFCSGRCWHPSSGFHSLRASGRMGVGTGRKLKNFKR
ncbi:unnamed protein product [Staurois parvus]|uniref:Secreted protein n=1 Tax=Staurois parvus TaxID=386267 RepID=A0ABN9BC30_9NEOB|nr:unnamed protein product [Staurois parvus]